MNLTTNQKKATEAMPATAQQIATTLGYSSVSGVYDLVRRASKRDPSYVFDSDENGVWDYTRIAADGGTETETGGVETHRTPTAQKQVITKTANDFLSELEVDLRNRLRHYEPTTARLPNRSGRRDMVMFRTDDHFGGTEIEVNIHGETVETFNSEVAEERVFQHLDEVLAFKRDCERMGVKFDTIHLLMNGDHVTNENIYDGQAHDIDQTLRGQVKTASGVYVDLIKTLSEEFDAVQVICQHGNHGELRAKGMSNQANADDLMYDALDLALRQSDVENVRLITNHVDTHTEFAMRGHRGHMRHGQDSLGHIGTTSGVKRWQSWLQESMDRNMDSGWDVGYVGHYHELKWEPVAGRPVLMGGTLQPTGDYENSLGIAPGRPGAWSHTVTDDEPIDLIRPTYFE
jgi:hypothetical protein